MREEGRSLASQRYDGFGHLRGKRECGIRHGKGQEGFQDSRKES